MNRKNSRDTFGPWEIWCVFAAGAGVAGVIAFRGADFTANQVPDLQDLMPWRVAAAFFALWAVAEFLAVLARFSDDPTERTHVKLATGVLEPLIRSATAGSAMGLAGGWAFAAFVKDADPDAALAILVGVLAVAVLGIVLLFAAGLGRDGKLIACHNRLNPRSVTPRDEPDRASDT